MHSQMRWGGDLMGHGGEHQMAIPLVPAPVAFFAMMFGLAIGIVIGHKKSMMHGMGRGMGCADAARGDWAARKKMMGGWSGHHHHGDGMPACACGYDATGEGEGVTDE